MNVDDILSGNESTDSSNLLPDLSSSISNLLAPLIGLSVLLFIVFIGLYLYSMSRRRRLENALFDIQKNIAELNARDKARVPIPPASLPQAKPHTESRDGAIIAHTDDTPRKY